MKFFQALMIVLFMMAIPALLHYRHWKITKSKEKYQKKKEELIIERHRLVELLKGRSHLLGFEEGTPLSKDRMRFRYKHMRALVSIGIPLPGIKDLNELDAIQKEMEKCYSRIESIDNLQR